MTSKDYKYFIVDDKVVIDEYLGNDPDVKIPETIDGKRVTSIGSYAFSGCAEITSVTVPDGVTSIDELAFVGCHNLKQAIIPKSVESIGSKAFAYCYELEKIEIPENVTKIGDWAFRECSSLTDVTISNGVTSIGDYAFVYCTELKNVVIPNSVTSIGEGAFECCKNLTSIDIPNGVKSIGYFAFDHCDSLESVIIPNSVESIDPAFSGCRNLKSVTCTKEQHEMLVKGRSFTEEQLKKIKFPNARTNNPLFSHQSNNNGNKRVADQINAAQEAAKSAPAGRDNKTKNEVNKDNPAFE